MHKKKTVLFVAPYFPPHSGGLERYVSEIVKHIDKTVWKVAVLTTGERNENYTEEFEGCTVHRLKIDITLSNTPFSFRWFIQVRKLLKTLQPDVVNVHMPVPGLGDVVTFLLPRTTPLVVTYHGESMRKGSVFIDILVWLYEHGPLAYVLHKAKHIICSSDAVRFHFLYAHLNKSSTVLPGVDVKMFCPDDSKKAPHPSILFVAGLGKGDAHKGLDTLLLSLKQVQKTINDIKLVVVGDGNNRTFYEEKVRKLGLSDAVTFTGKLHGQSLVNEYQKAHVFVLPTKNESFGMVIAEAMATALPVVSTHVGGVPFLVDAGVTGELVSPRNSKALANEIIQFLSNPDTCRKFGEAGRKKMKEGYAWEQRAQAHAKVFEESLIPRQCIAHIVGYYPPHIGGMEVVAQEISHELAEKQYDVRVFTSSIDSQGAPSVERSKNLIVRRLRSVEFAHTPIMWSLLFHLLTLPQKTILHIHLAQIGIPEIAILVAKIRRFPIVMHFHLDVEPSGPLGWLFLLYKKHILGIVLRSAQKIIVFSEEQKSFVHTTYKVQEANITIIPNGIDVEFLQLKKIKNNDTVNLLYVGRLTVQKRLERIIEAIPLLTFDATLTLVGDGEDRKELEALAQKVAPGKIIFTGRKSLKQARKYYQKSDVFVIPSDKEGMPMVILEAMAVGVPIVASNVMGLRESLKGIGVLVDDLSAQGFADALNTLVSSPEHMLEASEKGKVFAKNVTWPVIVSKVEDVYKSV